MRAFHSKPGASAEGAAPSHRVSHAALRPHGGRSLLETQRALGNHATSRLRSELAPANTAAPTGAAPLPRQDIAGPARADVAVLERQADEIALRSLGSPRRAWQTVPGGTVDHAKRWVAGVLGEDLSRTRIEPSSLGSEPRGTLARTRGERVEVLPEALRPDLAIGQALLAHELTHVVQQRKSLPQEQVALEPFNDARRRLSAAESGMTQRTVGCSGGCQREAPVPQPLVEQARAAWGRGDREALFRALRSFPRGPQDPDPSQDAELRQFVQQNLGQVPFDLAYAQLLLRHGTEANWPRGAELNLGTSSARPAVSGSGVSDVPAMPITAYYFQGRTQRRALVIGGVHGAEQSGIEVVQRLREQLSQPNAALPEFTTILVPVLFPSNYEYDRRYRAAHPDARGTNLAPERGGRYSRVAQPGGAMTFVEPNRNLPLPGEGMREVTARPAGAQLLWPGDRTTPLGDLRSLPEAQRPDQAQRVISTMLPENVALVTLIERFRPERIVSVHAHRPSQTQGDAPGIYVDPRGGVERNAQGLATATRTEQGRADDALARDMRERALALGLSRERNNPGNDIHYSERPGIRPPGTSLGDWAPVAGSDGRPAATMITVEVEGYSPASEVPAVADRVRVHERAIREVFLGQ